MEKEQDDSFGTETFADFWCVAGSVVLLSRPSEDLLPQWEKTVGFRIQNIVELRCELPGRDKCEQIGRKYGNKHRPPSKQNVAMHTVCEIKPVPERRLIIADCGFRPTVHTKLSLNPHGNTVPRPNLIVPKELAVPGPRDSTVQNPAAARTNQLTGCATTPKKKLKTRKP
jgi:hypothetical protein